MNNAFTLSATILCPMFRPGKGPKYIEEAKRFRMSFKGIAAESENAPKLRYDFIETVNFRNVRSISTIDDVFASEFSNLFESRVYQ